MRKQSAKAGLRINDDEQQQCTKRVSRGACYPSTTQHDQQQRRSPGQRTKQGGVLRDARLWVTYTI